MDLQQLILKLNKLKYENSNEIFKLDIDEDIFSELCRNTYKMDYQQLMLILNQLKNKTSKSHSGYEQDIDKEMFSELYRHYIHYYLFKDDTITSEQRGDLDALKNELIEIVA